MTLRRASTRRVARVALALVATALAACAPPSARAPAAPSDDAAFVTAERTVAPGLAEDDATAADAVSAGDTIAVRYIGTKDLEPVTVVVDRAGRVHLPLLGDIDVGGLPIDEAEKGVQRALAHYDRFSKAALTITESRGRYVSVTGAVEKPGVVPIVGDARVADILASVGGPRQTTTVDKLVQLGDVDGIRVVRKGKALPIDARLAMQGAAGHNVRVIAGDVIVVPPALDGRIVVLGHVTKPQTFSFRRGLRLTEVIADSGGLTKEADLEDVRILRGGYGQPKLFVANMKDLLAGARPDVELAPGDIVFVTEHWFATVGQVLERVVPIAATGLLIAGGVK